MDIVYRPDDEFTDEEIDLSCQIEKLANHVIHSEDEYPTAAAALLVCNICRPVRYKLHVTLASLFSTTNYYLMFANFSPHQF